MSEQPRPIRAWGEYDDGRLWLDMHDVQEMDAPAVFVPSTAEGLLVYIEAVQDHTDDWSLPGFIRWWGAQEGSGPLRSLRVLLSTGHEIEVIRKSGAVTVAQGRKAVMLEPGCMKFSLFTAAGTFVTSDWYMPEVTDTDAVERAIAAAVACVEGQE